MHKQLRDTNVPKVNALADGPGGLQHQCSVYHSKSKRKSKRKNKRSSSRNSKGRSKRQGKRAHALADGITQMTLNLGVRSVDGSHIRAYLAPRQLDDFQDVGVIDYAITIDAMGKLSKVWHSYVRLNT